MEFIVDGDLFHILIRLLNKIHFKLLTKLNNFKISI